MVEDLPDGIFWCPGSSHSLTSLFTTLPCGRHYKERQGKDFEVLSSHSNRGHAHNSGKLPTSHVWGTSLRPLYLLLTPSLSGWASSSLSHHLEKTSQGRREAVALGGTWGARGCQLALLLRIVLAEALTFCPSSWHGTWYTCNVEPS